MAASGGEDFMSDELIINKCCVCTKKNRTTEAAKYCVECKDYFCKQCVDIHAVFPGAEGHKLLDKSDFRSVKSGAGSLPSYSIQRCDQHKSEVLNMYCQDHEEVACATCIGLNHRCQENERTLIKALKIALKEAVDSVKTYKQELQILLDNIEKQTVTELKKEYDRIEKSLEDEIKEAEKQNDALNKMAFQLKHAEGNKSQEFVCVKTSEKLMKMNDEMNKQHIQSEETVTFTAEQSIKSYLQQLKVFGKATSKTSAVQKMQQVADPKSNLLPVAMHETKQYKVTKQREIIVKVRDDKEECDICDSCITEDGVLLIVDHTNQKLKRVDLSTETVTDYLNLKDRPQAVCQISKTEAAVSLRNNSVQFFSLGDKMRVTRKLSFKHPCWGLAYTSHKLFITEWGTSLYICDRNGKQLRRVTTDGSGKDIFSFCRQIVVSAEGDKVFVADDDKGLIILDNQGNYLSSLNTSDVQVSELRGVCTDDRYVYVCGRNPDNISQLTRNCEVIAPIGTVKSPYSICIDPRKSRLYVTKNGSDAITVLELV